MPSPGGIYTSPYPGGWQDGPAGATPITAAALDVLDAGIKTSLQGPTSPADGDVAIWDASANGGLGGWNSTTNKKIARTQIGTLALVDADIASGAAIQLSKLLGFPSDATKFARGDGIWAAAADKSSANFQIFAGNISTAPAVASTGNTGVVLTASGVVWIGGAAATNMVLISATGDATARLILTTDPAIKFGAGSGGQDVVLQRTGAATLTLTGSLVTSAGLQSNSPTAGVGYAQGSGGSVVQATSKTTPVTLNKTTGQITLNNASMASNTIGVFTLTNSSISANDGVLVWLKSPVTAGVYNVWVDSVSGGSCTIGIHNLDSLSHSDAVIIGFAVIKGQIT